jgi:hypothetical protein
MSAPAAPVTKPHYYIADGVHRAVAARENKLLVLPARLVVQGQADRLIYVSPDQLHSPKASISRRVTARRNCPALEAALATPAGRAATPPIEVQPLGAAGSDRLRAARSSSDRTLRECAMSNLAPPAVQARLLRILHRAFVQARNLALRSDGQQLYDLADTFELLPELMAHWDETALDRIRSILAEYDSRHPQSGYEYLSLLDEDDPAISTNGFNVAASRGEETGRAE